jgi:O-antigen/teichoic acid export membrane protein
VIGLPRPERIMTVIWGPAYVDTGGILRILLLSAPLVFVGLVGVPMAMALGQERRLMLLMGLATVFNVALNAIAIPRWGTEGAAWVTLATEMLIAGGLALTIRRGVRIALRPAVTTVSS